MIMKRTISEDKHLSNLRDDEWLFRYVIPCYFFYPGKDIYPRYIRESLK